MRMSTGHECTKRKLPTEVALGCRRPTLASKGMEQTSVNTVISNLFQSDTENSRSSNRYNKHLVYRAARRGSINRVSVQLQKAWDSRLGRAPRGHLFFSPYLAHRELSVSFGAWRLCSF